MSLALDAFIKPKLYKVFEFLEQYGNNLTMPLSKPLGNGLFELRITGNKQIRFFVCIL